MKVQKVNSFMSQNPSITDRPQRSRSPHHIELNTISRVESPLKIHVKLND